MQDRATAVRTADVYSVPARHYINIGPGWDMGRRLMQQYRGGLAIIFRVA